jgi:hypothetical protein
MAVNPKEKLRKDTHGGGYIVSNVLLIFKNTREDI